MISSVCFVAIADIFCGHISDWHGADALSPIKLFSVHRDEGKRHEATRHARARGTRGWHDTDTILFFQQSLSSALMLTLALLVELHSLGFCFLCELFLTCKSNAALIADVATASPTLPEDGPPGV